MGRSLAKLQLLQFVFQVIDVSSPIADVAIDTCLDRGVVGGLAHVRRGIDKSLFSFDLAVDLGNGMVGVGHGGGGRGAREEQVAGVRRSRGALSWAESSTGLMTQQQDWHLLTKAGSTTRMCACAGANADDRLQGDSKFQVSEEDNSFNV
jgi:hypothetical protein